ncbi:hypothetical protein B484DRAFT_457092 [Ochromonadaceae sp. CCMP2298]|nr:hypothetical protein B484DRAFT_457092 [Ochromonadaceae sp. CCMP2298]
MRGAIAKEILWMFMLLCIYVVCVIVYMWMLCILLCILFILCILCFSVLVLSYQRMRGRA